MSDAFELARPKTRDTAVIFASPHSGRDYPRDFIDRATLDDRLIRSSEDAFVDKLIGSAPEVGAALLTARVPRAYIDLNRSAEELDPALIEDVRPIAHNPRVASGLGVIPRVVAGGRPIYSGKLSRSEAERRIETCWRPYHRALSQLIAETERMFGQAILIDMHSMPHEAIDGIARGAAKRPEVVIGDRFGASAAPHIVDRVEEILKAAGLQVVRNAPFAGAYVVQHYGRPGRRHHAVQIEIDRALYMDERRIAPNANFEAFSAVMRQVVRDLAAIGRGGRRRMPLAAE